MGAQSRKKLTQIQKKCLRHVAGVKNYLSHSIPLLEKLGMVSFKDLYENKLKLLCYKFLYNKLPKGIQHIITRNQTNGIALRNHRELMEPKVVKQKQKLTPRFQAPRLWNKLEKIIKECQTENSFKKAIKRNCIINYGKFQCPNNATKCISCAENRPLWT